MSSLGDQWATTDDELLELEAGAKLAGIPWREFERLVRDGAVETVPVGARRRAIRLSEIQRLAIERFEEAEGGG